MDRFVPSGGERYHQKFDSSCPAFLCAIVLL
jgi:hypothetical protein